MKYCDSNGLKLGFIAKTIGLNPTLFSQWLHGKRDIDSYYTRQLEEYFT